jgi:hypothetical protein
MGFGGLLKVWVGVAVTILAEYYCFTGGVGWVGEVD